MHSRRKRSIILQTEILKKETNLAYSNFGNITEGDKQKINRSIKKAGKIVGEELPLLNDLYKKHSITKALNIVNDPCHPLWNAYQISGRSGRFITVHSKTERYKKSFVPATSRKIVRIKNPT